MADNRAARALRDALKERSQVELAKVTGISQPHLSRLASGERVASDRSDALGLKRELGIELEWWDEPVSDGKDAA